MDYSKYHSVIFDVDGTVLNTLDIWKQIDCEYLAQFGIDCPNNLQSTIAGMSIDEMTVYFKKTFNIDRTLEEMKLDWLLMSYDLYAHQVTAKNGIFKFMSFLKDQGKTIGLASSNRLELIMAAFKHLDLWPFVHSIAFTGGKIPGKPDPMVFQLCAAYLETNPKHCLVFEDSRDGVLAARSAGMDVIAVNENWPDEDKRIIHENTLFTIDDFTKVSDGKAHELIRGMKVGL